MDDFIDEAGLQCLPGAHVLAGEDHVERGAEADEARQSVRAARPRDQAELHFRQREERLGVLGRDAVRAGQRQLEAPAQARAVDRRDDGSPHLLDPIHQLLAHPAQPLRLGSPRELHQLFHVRARDPDIRFAAQ